MAKIFLMQPRQSGKTTKAMWEYIKDPENTVFVAHNQESAKWINERLNGIHPDNFMSAKSFPNKMLIRRPKNIIMDEYMFFPNKEEIYKTTSSIQPENLYIFSTSDKQYNKEIFDLVKKFKKVLTCDDVLKLYKGEPTKGIEKEIRNLYYNFITDKDTKLIDINYNQKSLQKEADYLSILGQKQYEIEMLNIYLK